MASNGKGLLDLKKPELVDIIHQLQEKVKELQGIEIAQNAALDQLPELALGAKRNTDGSFSIIKIAYDLEKNSAQIAEVVELGTKDPSLLIFNLNKASVEQIVRKVTGDRYKI